MSAAAVLGSEAADFAASVAAAVERAALPADAWRPGAVADDRCPALSDALAAIGWLELAADAGLAPLAGPAGAELGRRLAPLRDLDALLGGSPLAGDLVRHGAARAIERDRHGELRASAVMRSEPVAYGDALGVHRVLELGPPEPVGGGGVAVAAWTAATAGYLAGLSEWALARAVEYTRGRRAFGAMLADLAPVQQRLADAATSARGLRLLAADTPGAAALAHAGAAAVEVTAACQQVVGAVGFTLEFPLQRAFRRARSVQLWSDAFLGVV